MSYWFVKSPFKHHSWEEILLKGKFQLFGIRNFQARNNIIKMEIGEKALFYSSSNGRKIFGIMEVFSKPYSDPSTKSERWFAIDFKPIKTFPKPIVLEKIKELFPEHKIITQARVSVVVVSVTEFREIEQLGNL